MDNQPPRQDAREVEVADADTNIRKAEYNTNAAEGASPSGAEMLARALELARHGFPVFPVAIGKKKPTITGRLELATTDPAEIRRLWTAEMWEAARRNPSIDYAQADAERAERIRTVRAAPPGEPRPFNIGISTAKPMANGDHFFALDFDVRGGAGYLAASAGERRKQLAAKVGELPPAPFSWTGSHGVHAFYNLPDGVEVRSRAGVIPGVDVRGGGDGYVIGPGSVVEHRTPNSAVEYQAYEWSKSSSIAKVAMPEATPAMLELCKAAAEGTQAGCAVDENGNVPVEGEADTGTAIALAAEYLKTAEPDAGPSNRHEPLMRIGRKLGDMGLSAAMATDLTEEHWPEAPNVSRKHC